MTAGWCARALRAAVFAAVCVLLAALGHVMMSKTHVPLWALAAGGAVTGATGWCLAGRERGLPLITAVVVAGQTALHSAFSLAPPGPAGTLGFGTRPSGMAMDRGPMPPDAMDMGAMGPSLGHLPMHHVPMGQMSMGHMDHLGQSMDGTGSTSFGMLAAHLLAALLTGLWLAHGERAAFRILRAVAGWLAAPLRLLLAVPPAPRRPRFHRHRPRSDRGPGRLLLVHAITTRGPPLGTAVV